MVKAAILPHLHSGQKGPELRHPIVKGSDNENSASFVRPPIDFSITLLGLTAEKANLAAFYTLSLAHDALWHAK